MHFTGKFFPLSIHYPDSLVLDKRLWPTIAHWWAWKCAKLANVNKHVLNRIERARSPWDALHTLRMFSVPRPDNARDLMAQAFLVRLLTTPEYEDALLAAPKIIYDATQTDTFWHKGKHLNGQNQLGKIHMGIRKALQAAQTDQKLSPSAHDTGRIANSTELGRQAQKRRAAAHHKSQATAQVSDRANV